jgi:hypothetical protein
VTILMSLWPPTRSAPGWSPVSPDRGTLSRASSIHSSELTPNRLELLSELVFQARVIAPARKPEQSKCRAAHWRRARSGACEGGAAPYAEGQHESEIGAAFTSLVELHAAGLVVLPQQPGELLVAPASSWSEI